MCVCLMDSQPGVHACGITRLSKVVYTCVSADQLGNYIALYEKSATVYLILAKEHRDPPLSHFPSSPILLLSPFIPSFSSYYRPSRWRTIVRVRFSKLFSPLLPLSPTYEKFLLLLRCTKDERERERGRNCFRNLICSF